MTLDIPYRPWRTALLILLPLSLVLGVMFAGVGSAIWEPITGWGAHLVCAGNVVDASRHYSTPSGGSGIEFHTLCQRGEGKNATAEEITWQALFVTTPAYAAVAFALMIAFMLRQRRKDLARSPVAPAAPAFSLGRRAMQGQNMVDIMGMVAAAMREGNARVIVPGATFTPGMDTQNVSARLTELRQLHDSGLISAEEFAAKKADVLAGL